MTLKEENITGKESKALAHREEYRAKQKAKVFDDKPELEITAIYRHGDYTRKVYDASFVEDGKIAFSKAYGEWSNGRSSSVVTYKLKQGIAVDADNTVKTHNIKWENVQEINNPPYGAGKFLREKGFIYDSDKKSYKRPDESYQGFTSKGTTLRVDSKLPSNLSNFKEIKGNTYEFKTQIKNAGFKWNGKSWIKE